MGTLSGVLFGDKGRRGDLIGEVGVRRGDFIGEAVRRGDFIGEEGGQLLLPYSPFKPDFPKARLEDDGIAWSLRFMVPTQGFEQEVRSEEMMVRR